MTEDKLKQRSIVEEAIGILWAILAVQVQTGLIFYIAVFMSAVSFFAAIWFATAALRSNDKTKAPTND